MYWMLICLPLIIEVIGGVYSLHNPIVANRLIWIWVLIGRPSYLLLVNYLYIKQQKITYIIGLLSVICIICLSVGVILLSHKIKYGVFIGDVPEGIYYLLIGIPTIIILIGMGIIYFLRKKFGN